MKKWYTMWLRIRNRERYRAHRYYDRKVKVLQQNYVDTLSAETKRLADLHNLNEAEHKKTIKELNDRINSYNQLINEQIAVIKFLNDRVEELGNIEEKIKTGNEIFARASSMMMQAVDQSFEVIQKVKKNKGVLDVIKRRA